MVIVFAALFMALGLVNLDFSRTWLRGQVLRLAVGVPILLVYAYVEMPALVFPQCVTLLLLTLVPNAAYSILLAARTALASRRVVSIRRTPARPYLVAVAVVAVFAAIFAAAPFVDASGLRDVADVTISASLPPSADTAHVRVVPEESAIFAGNKVVGQLGAYYRVGEFNVQATHGKLVWVAPLEFQGFVQWLSRRTSPGVIVVSAENPDEQPEVRERAPMRYIPSALLNDNLYRHVYMRYGTEQILETTLQLDDAGDPQYLCTLGRPTIGWTGTVVTGVALVDPATGAMRRIDRKDFGTLPAWVSRVVPADLALAYNEWFGEFVHGIWNYLLVKRDVHVPARDEVFGLLAGSRFVWFVDHTSPASDQSMTGFTYMDTVNGHITYYTSSGGEFNSRGAEDAVASNPVVRQGKLIPTQPLLYNAFGQNTWVVPLVAETGKYQTVALVQAKNGHVVVGSEFESLPQRDAFAQYAAFLGGAAGPVAAADEARDAGAIDRVATAPDGTVYLTLRGDRRIFTLSAHDAPAALLARPGDRVRFRAAAVSGGFAAIEQFVDSALAPVKRVVTDRLVLEPVGIENASTLWKIMQSGGLREFQDVPRHTRDEFARRVASRPKHFDSRAIGRFEWLIVVAETRAAAGWISLRVGDHARGTAEIGYSLLAPFRGNGFAAEAARGMVRHAFGETDLKQIDACCVPQNVASRTLLAAVGFEETRVQKNGAIVRGRPVDIVIFEMTREQYDTRNGAALRKGVSG